MHNLKNFLGPMRVSFLLLTPACVLLGTAAASWSTGAVSPWHFLLALAGGVCAHIAVNALNEYSDFRTGLDYRTQRTAFSGGSGTLPERPELATRTLMTGVGAAALVALVGLYFLRRWGLSILPLGILGLAVVAAYTPWLTRRPILCLVAPGIGFGPLMVMGTDFALAGRYSWTALVASLVPFFLVNNLLLLNQFPDVEADRSVGRRHLPIVAGRRASSLVYAAFLLCAYLSIVAGVLLGLLPAASLIGLATLALAVPAAIGAYRHADDLARLKPAMVMNVAINLGTPLLVALGLFLA
ncbi:MAG: prenyltransferase [Pirellulaceae bacterium]|jgi:1,4-dihydroxy-2-naphthoate octaprenyltransferase|nr:prenyltransferase [Pirellulaceae bacterium]